MRKTVLFSLIVLLVLLFFLKKDQLLSKIHVATSYAAKCACTNLNNTNRSLEDIQKYDLADLPIPLSISHKGDTVIASTMLGIGKMKAVPKHDLGCALVIGKDDYNVDFKKSYSGIEDTLFSTSISKNRSHHQGIDYAKIDQAVEQSFDADYDMTDKKTRALIVAYKGEIIAEKYAKGHDKNTPMTGWSMSKSITNAMIGLMAKDGLLSIDDNNLFDSWTDDRKSIKVRDLLHMNTGLDWEEDYTKKSDATEMLFMSEDIEAIAKNIPLKYPIGTHWYYSSGTTNLLMALARSKFATLKEYHSYLYQRLFKTLGMNSTFIETDEKGTFVGSSFVFATARDWLRFGALYAQNGVWNGEQILPENWVSMTREEAKGSEGKYGAQFWLNINGAKHPNAPYDMFSANGFQGQKVAIFPSQDLIIVRLGFNSDFDFDTLFTEVIGSIPQEDLQN